MALGFFYNAFEIYFLLDIVDCMIYNYIGMILDLDDYEIRRK